MNELEYSIDNINVSSVSLSIKKYLYLFIKRGFDIILSLIGIFFLIPISIIIKISYILDKDYDSIFYTQDRIGKNGKTFKLYKFRSMVPNADEVLKKMLKQKKYRKEWKLYQKFHNDPRITKIGKLLRKTSLDELPQLINIFVGNMSFIGPRPLVPGELDAHNGNHELYESVRPGLSSWWAVNGRSDISYEDRLELEYYYVKHQGFKMDLKCIFMTVKVVLGCKGAK